MARARAYVMQARARQGDERRARVVAAAAELFLAADYDDVTLQAVAERSGVSQRTVARQFGSKENLLVATARAFEPRERALRTVAPGDVRGVARVLADRYEVLGPLTARWIVLEARSGAVAELMRVSRRSHLEWLAEVFAADLPPRGRVRDRRLAELFAATEIFVWSSWRRHLGLGRRQAERAMADLIGALLARFRSEGGGE